MIRQIKTDIETGQYLRLMQYQGQEVHDLLTFYETERNRHKGQQSPNSASWLGFENEIVNRDYAFWRQELENPLEPSRYAAILQQSSNSDIDTVNTSGITKTLENKITGGWLGKLIGTILGSEIDDICKEAALSRRNLSNFLRSQNNYPPHQYVALESLSGIFPDYDSLPEGIRKAFFLENIHEVPPSMSIDQNIVQLIIAREHSQSQSPEQHVAAWLRLIPLEMLRHAERAAAMNFLYKLSYPSLAVAYNPFREYGGAHGRTEMAGLINPGQPQKAAAMAWYNAAATHVRTGIYSAMWSAAMIAAAYVETEPWNIVMRGLEHVPAQSRFVAQITEIAEWSLQNTTDFEKTLSLIEEKHTKELLPSPLLDACIITAALLHGSKSFISAMGIAAASGINTTLTTSVTATIAGVLHGKSGIPSPLILSLGNTIRSSVCGYSPTSISRVLREMTAFIKAAGQF